MHDPLIRAPRPRRRNQRGFTFIELLVVITVVALLAAIVIFNIEGVASKGGSSAACTDEKSVWAAVEAAWNDGVVFDGTNMGSATDPWSLIVPKYIHSQPPARYGRTSVSFALTGSQATGWTVAVTGFTC